jgi:hypothetical protein
MAWRTEGLKLGEEEKKKRKGKRVGREAFIDGVAEPNGH